MRKNSGRRERRLAAREANRRDGKVRQSTVRQGDVLAVYRASKTVQLTEREAKRSPT